MTFRKTLLVCLPLLVVVSCKGKSNKKNAAPAPVIPVATTSAELNNTPKGTEAPVLPTGPVTLPTLPGAEQSGGTANQNESQNQNQNPNQNPNQNVPTAPVLPVDPATGTPTVEGGKDVPIPPVEGPKVERKPECETLVLDFASLKGDALKKGDRFKIERIAGGIQLTSQESRRSRRRSDSIILTFTEPTSLISVDLVRVDANDSNLQLFTGAEDSYPRSIQLLPSDVTALSIDDHSYIQKLKINLSGSGTIDNLKICIKN